MNKELLATVNRQRGDARLCIEGIALGAQGRRVVMSIQTPVDVADECEERDNWNEQGRFALRLVELDELIAKLQAARSYLV